MSVGSSSARIPLSWDLEGPGPVLGGLDLETLLDRSLVEPGATHVTPSQRILLMLNSIDMTGDEAHAMGAGRLNHGFASLGLRTMLSTASLGPALEVLGRYFATCSSVIRIEVDRQGDMARVSLRAEGPGQERCEVLEEIWFNALYTFMCWFVGRRIPVLAATVSRPDQPNAYRVHWAAHAPLARGETSSLLIPRACLEWGRKVEDVEEPVWEALRFSMDGEASGGGRIGLRTVFLGLDAPAKARAQEISQGRFVGERQLSRRMRREHGASFRDLRGDALVEVAKTLLRSTDMPIEAVAARLGYAEERSFRRFVRGRTGLTPAQIRKGVTLPPATSEEAVRAKIRALTRKMEL